MRTTLHLADRGRTSGSYYRQPLTFSGDSLYSYYRHAGVTLTLPVAHGPTFRAQDDLGDALLSAGEILDRQRKVFEDLVLFDVGTPDLLQRYDRAPIEYIQKVVIDARKAAYGVQALENGRRTAMDQHVTLDGTFICQNEKKQPQNSTRNIEQQVDKGSATGIFCSTNRR